MLIFLFVIVGFLFFPVMFGLGVDSWRERAISEVRGLRDERGPTQLGIYPRTSLSWTPGTRCACPRMTEEKIILLLPALFFFLSLPDLIRISRDPRNALRLSEDDRRKNNTVIPGLLFFPVIPVFFSSPLSFPYSFLLLCHSRAWHGNLKEMSGSRPDMTRKKSPLF